MYDDVDHPKHYNSHPSGIECITVAQHHTFAVGNVFKYIWRAGLKKNSDTLEDLKKARKYLDFEIARLEKLEAPDEGNASTGSDLRDSERGTTGARSTSAPRVRRAPEAQTGGYDGQ